MANPNKPKVLVPLPAIWSKDLATAYGNVLGAFNAVGLASNNAPTDYSALVPILHTDIVIKKVARRESVSGIGNVISYLNTVMAPVFPVFSAVGSSPSTIPPASGYTFAPPSYTLRPASGTGPNGAAMQGVAYGIGAYQDANSGGPANVYFCWSFVRDEITKYWWLHNVYAHRTDL